jgi:hypothetical protein
MEGQDARQEVLEKPTGDDKMTVIINLKQEKKGNLVTCIECGTAGPEKFFGHVGHDAWKCVRCLFQKNNRANKEGV